MSEPSCFDSFPFEFAPNRLLVTTRSFTSKQRTVTHDTRDSHWQCLAIHLLLLIRSATSITNQGRYALVALAISARQTGQDLQHNEHTEWEWEWECEWERECIERRAKTETAAAYVSVAAQSEHAHTWPHGLKIVFNSYTKPTNARQIKNKGQTSAPCPSKCSTRADQKFASTTEALLCLSATAFSAAVVVLVQLPLSVLCRRILQSLYQPTNQRRTWSRQQADQRQLWATTNENTSEHKGSNQKRTESAVDDGAEADLDEQRCVWIDCAIFWQPLHSSFNSFAFCFAHMPLHEVICANCLEQAPQCLALVASWSKIDIAVIVVAMRWGGL